MDESPTENGGRRWRKETGIAIPDCASTGNAKGAKEGGVTAQICSTAVGQADVTYYLIDAGLIDLVVDDGLERFKVSRSLGASTK